MVIGRPQKKKAEKGGGGGGGELRVAWRVTILISTIHELFFFKAYLLTSNRILLHRIYFGEMPFCLLLH